jgi:hemolysin D
MLKKIGNFITNQTKNNNETEFLPAALEVVETPPSIMGRKLLWLLFCLLGAIILWSVFGHVDEVAVAQGKIIPVGNVKVVQAEDKGVVKAIHVKEGQTVKKGDLLLELDTTMTAADVARVKKEIAYYTLEIDRLLAEQQGASFMPQKYPELEERDVQFQTSLYQSRLVEYQVKLSAAEATIRQDYASLASAKANYKMYVSLYEIAKEKEQRIESLVKEDAVAEFTLFEHKSKRIQLEQNIAAQLSEIARLEGAIAHSRETASSVNAERQRDITAKMVEDRKQLQAYNEELKKAEEKNRLARIVSPIDGQVGQLAVHTVGGIVTAAQALMEIVPDDAGLEVEAWLANKDAGFVKKGQQAEVKVETFSFQKYGTVGATVLDVSPDAVEDKEKGRVYRILLSLDKKSFVVNDQIVPLAAGMSATGEIKVKEKRIIEFFLDPFRQYQSEALRER